MNHSANEKYEFNEFRIVFSVDPVKGGESDYNVAIIKKPIKKVVSITSNGRTMQGIFPFDRTTLIAVSEEGYIYTAWTQYFLIRKYDLEGNYVQGFYYPYSQVPLDHNDFFDFGMEAEELKKLDIPDTWPVLRSMKTDDEGRLWVSTITGNDKIYRWWILDGDGTLLATFDWPRDKEIKEVKNGNVYVLEEEEDSGIDQIVRYKREMIRN